MLQSTFVLLTFIVSSVSFATQNLVGVETAEVDGEFVTEIQFDGAVNTKNIKLEYHDNGIQVLIPNTTMTEPQKLVRVNKDGVKSILTTAKAGEGIRTKVFFDKEVMPSEIQGSARLVENGNTLQLRFDKNIFLQVATTEMKTPILSLGEEEQPTEKNNEIPVTSNSEIDPLNKEFAKSNIDTVKPKTEVPSIGAVQSEKETILNPEATGKKETEIPVLTASKVTKEAGGSTWLRMIGSLFVVGIMGFGMVLFSKWYQKRTKTDLGDNKIRILTQHYMGPRKSLAIVRVAGETILIGVTDQNISMLKSLSLIDDEIPTNASTAFDKSLLDADRNATAKNRGVEDASEDDFVIGNIKDRITTKLKDFRPLA